jgi:hypothetical protein
MNLLLLLTALFASLTGFASGERGVRQVQDVAVVRAAEMVQASAQRVAAALPVTTAFASAGRLGHRWAVARAPLTSRAALRFERRRE